MRIGTGGWISGLTAVWVAGCWEGPTATGKTVEMNVLEYSGRFREYKQGGLVQDREFNAQGIRRWRHSEIHYFLDTLRLDGVRFVFVANDVDWGDDTTDVGTDRRKTFAGAYEIRGDSLFLAVDSPEYFRRDTLAFQDRESVIRIEYGYEQNVDLNTGEKEGYGPVGQGMCRPPDFSSLSETEALQQHDLLILFSGKK